MGNDPCSWNSLPEAKAVSCHTVRDANGIQKWGLVLNNNPFFFITHYGSFCRDFDFRAGLTVDPVAQMRKLKLRLSDLSQITWCS